MQSDGTWKVLVIIVEAKIRNALTRCLEEDYRVLTAASAGDALSTLDSEEVDLVLCEHQLPDINAVEFFGKTRISHPEAIRIMITGQTDHHEMIRSINDAAVYQIVPKPWQPEHLLLLIWRALESRELARRHRSTSSGDWLLVSDTANSRLIGWHGDDCATGATARALTAQPDFHAKGDNLWQMPVRDSLCWPYGIQACVDTIVVSDSGNSRVVLWKLAPECKSRGTQP